MPRPCNEPANVHAASSISTYFHIAHISRWYAHLRLDVIAWNEKSWEKFKFWRWTFSHASHFNQKWDQNASCIKHPIKSKANNTDVWTDLDPGGILNGAEQALVGSGMMIFLDKIMLQCFKNGIMLLGRIIRYCCFLTRMYKYFAHLHQLKYWYYLHSKAMVEAMFCSELDAHA